jgi:ADP-ribose pyrophosphatase YjhB (NUDIX family)
MKRELLEEAGIDVVVGSPAAVYMQQDRRHIDHLFYVRVDYQSVKANSRCEIADVGWYSPDALPPLHREAQIALDRYLEWGGASWQPCAPSPEEPTP